MAKELISIYNEDCIVGMNRIKDKSIDCVLTDPPYGINYKSGWSKKFSTIANDKELFNLEEFFKEIDRVTKDDSAIYIYIGIQTLDLFMSELKKIATIRNLITVPRTQKGGNGSLKQSFSPQNEFMLFATKGKKKIEETQILRPSKGYLKDKRKKPKQWITRLPDYWHWTKAGVANNLRKHVTEKHESALMVAIQCSTQEGDTILDPFAGSGSSLFAAKKLNRKSIGFEIDGEMYQKILEDDNFK